MKKLFALLFALVMVLSLAACGSKEPAPSGGTSQQEQPSNTSGNGGEQSGGEIELKDANASNWEQAIEGYFGLKISLPNGWSVRDVKSLSGRQDIIVDFTKGGDETYESFGEKIFEELKRVATGDITTGISSPKVVNSFNEANNNGYFKVDVAVNNDELSVLINNADETLSLSLSMH